PGDLSIMLLLPVLMIGVRLGPLPAATASVLALAGFHFLFPGYSVNGDVGTPREWASAFTFVAAGGLVGVLSLQLRRRASEARQHAILARKAERRANVLAQVSFRASFDPNLDAALSAIAALLRDELGAMGCYFVLPPSSDAPSEMVHVGAGIQPPQSW